jgi:hypothetical protein
MDFLLRPLDTTDDFLGINIKCTKNDGCNTVQGCGCPIKTEP